ncbi:MAG: uracil-DNA glycosylase [bacterium]
MARKEDIFDLMLRAAEQQAELGLGEPAVAIEEIPEIKPAAVAATPSGDCSLELEAFHQQIKDCTLCRLHEGRHKFVFGIGNPNAEVMFVGEGPGRDEDLKGEPFVGRAGQLLDRILAAIKFDRTQIYIANIVKCRPPGNRDPQPDEMTMCMPYLKKQIELIDPTFICCLGRIAAQALLQTTMPLGKLRGSWHEFEGRKLIVTYHPAALLRFQQYKRGTWEDVQKLRQAYDELFSK